MDDSATQHALAQEEYRSLRATIQTRGSLRVALALATWAAWAALALYGWTAALAPVVGAISLVVLAGGFEIVLSLHAGVERVGRYIQLVFERPGPASGATAPPAWEHTAMSMGGKWLSPGGLDPLFSLVFLLAAMLNALPTFVSAESQAELIGAGIIHAAFIVRVLMARRYVARQRAADLAALSQVISSNSLVSKIQQER